MDSRKYAFLVIEWGGQFNGFIVIAPSLIVPSRIFTAVNTIMKMVK